MVIMEKRERAGGGSFTRDVRTERCIDLPRCVGEGKVSKVKENQSAHRALNSI